MRIADDANGVSVVVVCLIGFSQSTTKPNEYIIKSELLHLKWIHLETEYQERKHYWHSGRMHSQNYKKDWKEVTGAEKIGRVQLPIEGLSVE